MTRWGKSGGTAPLTLHLTGKGFATDDDVKQAVTSRLQEHDTDFFHATTQALVPRWDKWLNWIGDYVESGV